MPGRKKKTTRAKQADYGSQQQTMGAFESVREDFVQLWGAMGPFWGISPTTARVYSWLLTRAEPADMDEIMAGLDLSRGAVSMACRELREWQLVAPEKVPGSRRQLFHPATDLEKVMRNIVLIRKRREWDPVLENLKEWIPRLEKESSPDAAVLRQRLASLEGLVRLMDSLVEVFLKGGLVGKVGLKLLVKAAQAGESVKSSETYDDLKAGVGKTLPAAVLEHVEETS